LEHFREAAKAAFLFVDSERRASGTLYPYVNNRISNGQAAAPGSSHGEPHDREVARTEQGVRARSLRYAVHKRDYVAAERFWSDRYIQHSARISPGRDGLFNLVRGLPDSLRYEKRVILAEGDCLIAHERFSVQGRPRSWIAADIVRVEDGKLAEHWDVLQGRGDPSGIRQRSPNVRRPFPRVKQ
jgi:predicted SnoaL-like aldol condensation-catalyzing enzyme